MPKKSFVWIVAIILVVVLAIIFIWSTLKIFIGEHGTVNNIFALQKVYNKAGLRIASTYTNTLMQKFPFEGGVNWKLSFFKDTAIILTGRVNTNSLHQFIIDHPTTTFLWSGIFANGEETTETGWPEGKEYSGVVWKSIFFRSPEVMGTQASNNGQFFPVIECRIEFPSGKSEIKCF